MPTAALAITVIMPCHNGASTVGRAIDSVLAEQDVAFELVVVDDCSSDGSQDVIAARCGDPRLVFLPQAERHGGNRARNIGIEKSSAGLIAFLDADDEFLPAKLPTIVSFFAEHPHSDILIDSFELERDGVVSLRQAPDLVDSERVIEAVLLREINKPTPSLSIRKHALLKAGQFDESVKRRQDLDLLLRLVETGARFASSSKVLWRKHSVSGSITKSDDTFLPALIDICERHPVYLSNPRYRPGAARDFARSLYQLLGKGRWTRAAQEFGAFARSQGWPQAAELFALGTLVILKRAVVPRRRQRIM
jgi:glycosyltransferase involved in cell wall biosynthesis